MTQHSDSERVEGESVRTKNIIEGLAILAKYRDDQDGYDTGAEHDVLYAYATSRPVVGPDLLRLVELGWIQEEQSGDEEFSVDYYNAEESWAAYT